MDQGQIINVLQQAIYTVLMASLPMMGVGLVVGIIISIFQAATQINEQTLTFVPKIIAIFLALLVFAGFIFNTVNNFTIRMFELVNMTIK